jgi:hypothetical protein
MLRGKQLRRKALIKDLELDEEDGEADEEEGGS